MPESKPATGQPEASKSLLADLTLDERCAVYQQAMVETHGANPSETLLKELIACLRKGQEQEEEPEPTQEEEPEQEEEAEPEPEQHGRGRKRRAR